MEQNDFLNFSFQSFGNLEDANYQIPQPEKFPNQQINQQNLQKQKKIQGQSKYGYSQQNSELSYQAIKNQQYLCDFGQNISKSFQQQSTKLSKDREQQVKLKYVYLIYYQEKLTSPNNNSDKKVKNIQKGNQNTSLKIQKENINNNLQDKPFIKDKYLENKTLENKQISYKNQNLQEVKVHQNTKVKTPEKLKKQATDLKLSDYKNQQEELLELKSELSQQTSQTHFIQLKYDQLYEQYQLQLQSSHKLSQQLDYQHQILQHQWNYDQLLQENKENKMELIELQRLIAEKESQNYIMEQRCEKLQEQFVECQNQICIDQSSLQKQLEKLTLAEKELQSCQLQLQLFSDQICSLKLENSNLSTQYQQAQQQLEDQLGQIGTLNQQVQMQQQQFRQQQIFFQQDRDKWDKTQYDSQNSTRQKEQEIHNIKLNLLQLESSNKDYQQQMQVLQDKLFISDNKNEELLVQNQFLELNLEKSDQKLQEILKQNPKKQQQKTTVQPTYLYQPKPSNLDQYEQLIYKLFQIVQESKQTKQTSKAEQQKQQLSDQQYQILQDVLVKFIN